jgi:hypothetical protein
MRCANARPSLASWTHGPAGASGAKSLGSVRPHDAEQLEHVIRAAAEIADDRAIVAIESQSILGQFPDAPKDLLISVAADVYPQTHPDRTDLIDGSIGELSPFHEAFGYYAHGIGPETAVLPRGWESRLVKVEPSGARAIGPCLEVHDLVLSKYVAGREKDREFVRGVIRHGLARRETLLDRVREMPVERQELLKSTIEADFSREREGAPTVADLAQRMVDPPKRGGGGIDR